MPLDSESVYSTCDTTTQSAAYPRSPVNAGIDPERGAGFIEGAGGITTKDPPLATKVSEPGRWGLPRGA